MKLSHLAIKRPIATIMVVLLILLLGSVSLSRLNIDLLPNMSFPMAAVMTSYPGMGPEEIENMITKPLEGVLGAVTNLKNISSISQTGQSLIILSFNWGTNMDFITLEMREKIDLVKQILPQEGISPMVLKFNPAMLPIAQFGLSGIQDLVKLKGLAEKELIPRLERIDGVASVGLTGGLTREIRVEIDQKKMASYGLDLQMISNVLRMENLNLPSGKIKEGQNEYLIRTTGEFLTVEEIGQIMLPTKQLGVVPLVAVAEIRDTYKEITQMARMNGQPSVGFVLQKQADANTVRVTKSVFQEIEKIEAEYAGLKITPIMTQSRYIEDSINNVGKNAIYGGLLAILILLYFLRNIRSTVIIGAAIPISIIATFNLIYFSGLTLNLMSLGGLALGVGMLVDNSIVVLENIFRFRQRGLDRIEAAKKGVGEVASAIIASTVTTIIVFLPVVFVEGIASQLFNELALTVTFSLLASLGVALTFIPMLSAQILTVPKIYLTKKQDDGRIVESLRRYYKPILAWTIQRPWLVFGLVVVILITSLGIISLLGTEFIPEMDQGEIRITVRLPDGSVLEETEKVIGQIEKSIEKISEVETFFTSIGSRGDLMMNSNSQPEVGEVLIKLTDRSQARKTTQEVAEDIREELQNISQAKILVKAQGVMGIGGGFNRPVSIQLHGPDLQILKRLASDVVKLIENIDGVRQPEHSLEAGRPELQIKIDRQKSAQLGFTTAQIGLAVQKAVQGDIPTRYKSLGQEYDLRVQLKWADRKDMAAIKNILLTSPWGLQVPLQTLADLQIVEGPGSIERKNGTRMIEVTADLYGRNLGDTNQEIKDLIQGKIALPEHYSIHYGGQYQEMWSAFNNLGFALILAVILVFMVLAAQFESLLQPLTIMVTIPLALIGALFSLWITGYTISVLTIIGMILLSGIVVNNAIVLIDYINTLRAAGKNTAEAIIGAGLIRLRPILMTSLTTILGLIPLVFRRDQGSEIQVPMAVVVIGGLLFSTFLTLVVVPNIYILLDRLRLRLLHFYRRLQRD